MNPNCLTLEQYNKLPLSVRMALESSLVALTNNSEECKNIAVRFLERTIPHTERI